MGDFLLRFRSICFPHLEYFQEPLVVKEYFPGGWHGHDREGRPVFLLRSGPHFYVIFLMLFTCRLGQMDAKGLIKSVGEEGLTKLTLHICEEGIKLTEEASHRCFLTFFENPFSPLSFSGWTSRSPPGPCCSTSKAWTWGIFGDLAWRRCFTLLRFAKQTIQRLLEGF